MWNLEILRYRRTCPGDLTVGSRTFRRHRLDSNRRAVLLLDLPNGDGSVSNIEHALDETALGIARAIGELWHQVTKMALKLARGFACVQSLG